MFTETYPWQIEAQGTTNKLGQVPLQGHTDCVRYFCRCIYFLDALHNTEHCNDFSFKFTTLGTLLEHIPQVGYRRQASITSRLKLSSHHTVYLYHAPCSPDSSTHEFRSSSDAIAAVPTIPMQALHSPSLH